MVTHQNSHQGQASLLPFEQSYLGDNEDKPSMVDKKEKQREEKHNLERFNLLESYKLQFSGKKKNERNSCFKND